MEAFWDITPCSYDEVDQRFRGAYCLHHLRYESLSQERDQWLAFEKAVQIFRVS
jgi:hypothetical protein